jgi:hypothetical protein
MQDLDAKVKEISEEISALDKKVNENYVWSCILLKCTI